MNKVNGERIIQPKNDKKKMNKSHLYPLVISQDFANISLVITSSSFLFLFRSYAKLHNLALLSNLRTLEVIYVCT